MLKRFFSNLLSSFMGAWLALVLFGVVAVVVVIGLVAKSGISSSESVSVGKGSVLVLNLQGEIVETDNPGELDYMSVISGNVERPQSLSTLLKGLEEGASNKNIKGLYIECNGVQAAPATLNALRNAVAKFKKDKPVYAYGDNYSMADYYVASVADSIFVNPAGAIQIKGISGGVPFYKGLFDKLGVSFDVVKVGTYKSAVEPYILEHMSGPARAQLDTLYGNMWSFMRDAVASSRKNVTAQSLQNLAEVSLVEFAPLRVAKDAHLYDKAIYKRQMKTVLANFAGKKEKDLNLIDVCAMALQSDIFGATNDKHQIAVVYATGEILDGGSSGITSEQYVPLIVELAENDKVEGMVLRVNSPGGSAFASEQIGEALDYFRSKGKTLTVSMGDYAASGGYWIAAGADRIYADPLTVTGSIGIFGLIPNVKGLTEKLGVNIDMVSTTPNANFPNLFEPLNDLQKQSLQAFVERGYDTFVKRVAKGRNMQEARVRQIAEGRVWDARTARKIGLVDELGSLQDAIEWTAGKAGIEKNYNTCIYPQYEPSFWDMFPTAGMEVAINKISEKLGPVYDDRMVRKALYVLRRRPVQALMPEMEIRL